MIGASGVLTLSGTSTETDTDWKIVAAGDFNRDGQTELLWWREASGALRVWHMSALEQWDSIDVTPAVTDTQWEVAGVADVNRDGWLDIVWRHYGSGGLAAWFMRDVDVVQTVRLAPPSVADTEWRLVGVADINRDGHPDLVWQHRANGRLAVWYMNGSTMVQAGPLNPAAVSDPDWWVVGVR